MLNDQDEETEILPHIKMSKDFEIFEPIIMHPLFSILPWDENKKQSYDVFFEVCYLYSIFGPPVFEVTFFLSNTIPIFFNIFSFKICFQAKGGSKVYEYSVSNTELATVDNAGKVTTHSGPGEFDVKAYMPKSPNNFFESRVSSLTHTCLLVYNYNPFISLSRSCYIRFPFFVIGIRSSTNTSRICKPRP